jgi:hypothetical protein
MKRSAFITSVESTVAFHEQALEEFVNNSLPVGPVTSKYREGFDDFKTIDWCAAYVPVNGVVDILCALNRSENIKRISIPVASAFLVMCTKEEDDKYRVAWSCSLS